MATETKPIAILYVVIRKSDRAPYTYLQDKAQAIQYVAQLRNGGYGYGRKEEYLIIEYVPTRIIKQEEPESLEEIEKAYSKDE
jgi:hypothetical protein